MPLLGAAGRKEFQKQMAISIIALHYVLKSVYARKTVDCVDQRQRKHNNFIVCR